MSIDRRGFLKALFIGASVAFTRPKLALADGNSIGKRWSVIYDISPEHTILISLPKKGRQWSKHEWVTEPLKAKSD